MNVLNDMEKVTCNKPLGRGLFYLLTCTQTQYLPA